MDLKQFHAARATGGISVARLTEDTAVIAIRQFNPATGAPAEPLLEQHSIKELQVKLKSQEEANAALKDLIDFLAAAPLVGNRD